MFAATFAAAWMAIPESIGSRRPRGVKFLQCIALAFLICLTACGDNQTSSGPSSPIQPPPPPPPPVVAATTYVDCSAPSNGTGTQSSPWNTLASVSAATFKPGDQLLFKRGMTCSGILEPLGSGTTAAPIVIDAYGTGPQPIIDGGMNTAAVQLIDQQGWEINNLEVIGGNYYGVNIAGTAPDTAYTHFRLTNLNIHGAHHITTGNDSGEVFITIGNAGETINDIVIDGVIAHDSQVFYGIYIDAGVFPTSTSPEMLGNNITVQNSTAYNLSGIGITLFVVTNGLMQNNVVHNTGQCPLNPGCGSNTPGGLMDLYCHTCFIQNNEAYAIQDWSPWDGGDFDIDVWNTDNIVQYNYGHDSAGYCVSVFSADNVVGANHIVRYNVCSNNDQLANVADPGEIFMNTNGAPVSGTLDGVEIYNNTFYWNPTTPGPAFDTVDANFSGTNPNVFENNIIYSTVPNLVETTSDFALDNNIYFTTGAAPDWNFNSTDYTSLAAYQFASGQDAHSLFTDPLMNTPTYHTVGRPVSAFTLLPGSPAIGAGANICSGIGGTCSMGTQDFWGNPLPAGSGYNIGAWQ
ncbi:MAG: right-handed parallel beta-helix repeat-containing protein [Terracidiphilus sp.]|jgi:hypothetical protein